MKNEVINTEKQVSKKVTNNVDAVKVTRKIESAKIDLLKVISIKKEKIVSPINFKSTQVFHKEFKKDSLSLGAIRVNLISFNESLKANDENRLSHLIVDLLIKMKVKNNYEFIKVNFLPNKQGFYSSYKLLMYFRKNLELLQTTFK